jgi:hypothetical protein
MSISKLRAEAKKFNMKLVKNSWFIIYFSYIEVWHI